MRIARLGLALMKGARHRDLAEIEVTPAGPIGDREFCLVEPGSQRVVRTVEHPVLLRLRTWWSGAELVIEFPGRTVGDEPRSTGVRLRCDYWGRTPELELLESAHSVELSQFFGRQVMLARAVQHGDVVYGAALTLVTMSDLRELAERIGDPRVAGESARFRATVTVEDDGLLLGDCTGRRLRLGDALIEVTGPIPRCSVIDHHPVSGSRDLRLLKALGGYRRAAGEVWFGHYARVVSPGSCRTGDSVDWGA